MRPKLGSFSRYRPRVLTLAFLAAIAATIVLANLSEEFSHRKVDPRFPPQPSELEFALGEPVVVGEYYATALTNMSYGWPLRWRQYVTKTQFSGVLPYFPRVLPLISRQFVGRVLGSAANGTSSLAARSYGDGGRARRNVDGVGPGLV